MRRLIVNADDFGYHQPRNRAVVSLLEAGLLTSASILLNQPESPFAINFAHKSGRRCFGLHLNLSEGMGLSANRRLNPDGRLDLVSRPVAILRAPFYFREIDAQFERAARLLSPTHVDGHFHIHTKPLFWRRVLHNLKRYHIRKIRRYFTYVGHEEDQGFTKRAAKKLFDAYVVKGAGLKTTDFFFDVSYFLDHHERLMRVLPASCSIEIETHPDDTGNRDYQLLTSSAFRSAIGPFELISYEQL
jgi:predicted glycoside hydrolase/deacetylase ChbG (UPF0249 family)